MRFGRGRLGVLVVGLASLGLLLACTGPAPAPDNGADAPTGPVQGTDSGPDVGSPPVGGPEPSLIVDPAGYPGIGTPDRMEAPGLAPDYGYGYSYDYGYASGYSYPSYPPATNLPPAGIHVMGMGAVTVSPDLAILSVGVEARADEVQIARSRAAEAMDAVMRALEEHGVREQDIKTQHFSIHPEYTWREVVDRDTGYRHGEQVLLGYRVTNNIEVKVRDLDRVGEIIDAVAGAGGDAVRVHHVSFTIEDPRVVEAQARELAVKEARAKAEQMAGWAGESLGRLVYLVETSAPSPVRMDMAVSEAAPAADPDMPRTPIVPGDLEVRVSVQGVWDVQ